MIINKIYGIINGCRYSLYKKDSKIVIRDYGKTFFRICKDGIDGQGFLVINNNAVSFKEVTKLRIDEKGVLRVIGDVYLYPNQNIHVGNGAILQIGDGTYINEGTKISVKHKVTIGKKCAISNDVSIMDSDFHMISGCNHHETGVIIGDHVWIGTNVTILKNVVIGNGCVIAANSVVTKSFPANSLIAGNPARVIREKVSWE